MLLLLILVSYKFSLLFLYIVCLSVVVAADGFTYERTAIENWLKTNDHSPMTNERLAHKNLNPNKVVQQILATITEN